MRPGVRNSEREAVSPSQAIEPSSGPSARRLAGVIGLLTLLPVAAPLGLCLSPINGPEQRESGLVRKVVREGVRPAVLGLVSPG
jgi:hypothetical protein